MKKAFKLKKITFFIIFKELSIVKNYLRPFIASLNTNLIRKHVSAKSIVHSKEIRVEILAHVFMFVRIVIIKKYGW